MEGKNSYPNIRNKATFIKIKSLSPEDTFDRYFTDNTTPEMEPVELWAKDFFDEAYLKREDKPDYYARPYTASLSGESLSYIGRELKDKILLYLPEGKKINANALISDLEIILSENRKLTMASVNNVNDYIEDLALFFTDKLITAISITSEKENLSDDVE